MAHDAPEEDLRASISPICERLERVRRVQKIESVRAFWMSLGGKEGSGASYESARLYHRGREPSVQYLVRVKDVYGVGLEWLATGQGAGPRCSHEFVCAHCGEMPPPPLARTSPAAGDVS